MKTLVYLATPYSSPDAQVMHDRFMSVNLVAAKLMSQGTHIFSPISHTHPIALAGDLPRGWEFWRTYDEAIMGCCCKMIVLFLPGWQESKGIQEEMTLAKTLGIPIEFIDL